MLNLDVNIQMLFSVNMKKILIKNIIINETLMEKHQTIKLTQMPRTEIPLNQNS